jgi:hypothetical protein
LADAGVRYKNADELPIVQQVGLALLVCEKGKGVFGTRLKKITVGHLAASNVADIESRLLLPFQLARALV